MNLIEQRQQVTNFIHTSLKTWSTVGFDPIHGTFVEALDFDAKPLLDLNRRGRVQARQIYVYALANLWGFDPTGEYLRLSENAWDSAKSKYLTNHGGWIFSASPSGSPIDTHCYVYERAFTIMALSALSQATGKSEYEDEINVALNWLKTYCGAEHGGYNLGVPFDPSVPREQNPHMHLFEACMDGKDLCGGELAEIAKQLFELSIAHFISTTGALIEFFTQDWQPDPKTGKDYQPGHLMEWTWLLSQYSKTIQKDVPEVTKLYESACSWGLDSIGFGYDEVREGGDILRSTKRIWVQCEVLKGHCARFESTKEEVYLDRAQSVLANIFEHYLHEKTGSWYDQLNNKNENISKNAPASTMYHLLLALHEFLRVTD